MARKSVNTTLWKVPAA